MKRPFLRRAAALGLALLMTAGSTFASASEALGWELHTGKVTLSQGTDLDKTIFWSDTYSDLRTEYFITYTPNEAVTPTVAYGAKVLSKATLSSMAKTLESQGERLVSGINGDYFVLATGAPVGLVLSGGVLRATPTYSNSLAIGFYEDGTAFIGTPGLTVNAALPAQTLKVTGGVNKVRKISATDGTGGLVLLTSDFASTTQNTEAGVDVILVPNEESAGLTIGGSLTCTVEQVLESTGSISIPEGKLVLSLNGKDKEELLTALRALTAGDQVTLSVTARDERFSSAVEGLGTLYRMVQNGQVLSGLDSERTARSAVGIKADGTLVFYALDGKQSSYSIGATLTQVAQRLVELGCVDAVCLDGGGSTTLGAAYPGDTGMTVVNKPSDGAQRAVSTALFLTTDLQATGERASYYVTPNDSLLLSGASVTLKATALDTGYYPTQSGEVSWSVASGGGTVSADGVFTAGSESGKSRVTVSDGAASGTAYLTTVRTPDQITLSNQSTGAAVTSLSLDPGAQIDLKASAVYRKLALTAADTCFTWSVDPAVGTITAEGVFTAGEKSASGTLKVSAGGTSVSIPVTVAGHIKTLEDCEGDLSAFSSTSSVTLSAETGLDYVRYGRQSLKAAYDASSGTASFPVALTMASGEAYLSVWVYGDGSGNTLLATAADSSGGVHQMTLGALSFTGWKQLSAALPKGAVSLQELSVVYAGGQKTGKLWLDQFTTSNESLTDLVPPTVTGTLSGSTFTIAATDNVDHSIPKSSVSVTYDGAALSFTWNESTMTGSAALPAGDGGYHRVSVTVADASGNLARASADQTPAAAPGAAFADMDDHWAGTYAAYLYAQGVSNGVVSADGSRLFQPGKSITRAEFFAMTARWLGLDLSQYDSVQLPFADAAQIPDWALSEVKAMYSLGILKGAAGGDGSLRVNALSTISRAEAMTILGRTQARGYAEAEMSFSDAGQVPDWALSYVKTLVGQGVVSGYENKINPLSLISRAEVAKLLYTMR